MDHTPMPENINADNGTDEPQVDVQALLDEVAQESTEDAPEPEPEPEPAETADSEIADDEEEEDGDVPDLDTDILAALGDNAKLKQRWKDQWKGIAKREGKLKESEERLDVFARWEQALANPETARGAVELIARAAGVEFAPAKQEPQGDWEAQGYYSEKELELANKNKMLEGQIKAFDDRFSRLESAAAEREKAEQRAAYLRDNAPRIAKAIAGKYDGFQVDTAMIGKALEALPSFKDDPAKAVSMFYADELVRHAQGTSAKRFRKDLPEMPESASSKGFEIPENPEDYTLDHAFQELGLKK